LLPENTKKPLDPAPGDRRSGSGGVRGDWIGKQLRSAYDSTLSEPLPANLQELVGKLRKQIEADSGKSSAKPGDETRDR
jgi:hypothetical protein